MSTAGLKVSFAPRNSRDHNVYRRRLPHRNFYILNNGKHVCDIVTMNIYSCNVTTIIIVIIFAETYKTKAKCADYMYLDSAVRWIIFRSCSLLNIWIQAFKYCRSLYIVNWPDCSFHWDLWHPPFSRTLNTKLDYPSFIGLRLPFL